MLKVFNLGSVIRNHGPIVRQCNFSSKKGGKQNDDTTLKDDVPIEPLQLAYNSYEDLSSDPLNPPVIIMHGE